jgi:hypothetical protein
MSAGMHRVVVLAAIAACSIGGPTGPEHDEPADFDPVDWSPSDGKADFAGVPATFDRNMVMSDDVLLSTEAVDANAIQAFLEDSPYGTRSWLADYRLETQRFADVLHQVATSNGIDPVVLLARMQVESSLVSATVKPSSSKINVALGCGCPDASRCSSAYLGLGNQLRCAADVLTSRYADSVSGEGEWRLGHTKRTSDPLSVTPKTHATASLYAYTPWVLVGRGGNWLVWNVTRKFLKHFDEAGTLHLP